MNAVDTNVLIYAYDKANPERRSKAIELLSSISECVLLWQVTCEFIAASRKLANQGLAPEQAWEYLAEHLQVFPLIFPTCSVLNRARDLHLGGISYWDAMLISACLDAGVDTLYSEDVPGCPVPGLQIVNPFSD